MSLSTTFSFLTGVDVSRVRARDPPHFTREEGDIGKCEEFANVKAAEKVISLSRKFLDRDHSLVHPTTPVAVWDRAGFSAVRHPVFLFPSLAGERERERWNRESPA